MDEFGTGAPGPDPLSGGSVILVNVTVGGGGSGFFYNAGEGACFRRGVLRTMMRRTDFNIISEKIRNQKYKNAQRSCDNM